MFYPPPTYSECGGFHFSQILIARNFRVGLAPNTKDTPHHYTTVGRLTWQRRGRCALRTTTKRYWSPFLPSSIRGRATMTTWHRIFTCIQGVSKTFFVELYLHTSDIHDTLCTYRCDFLWWNRSHSMLYYTWLIGLVSTPTLF